MPRRVALPPASFLLVAGVAALAPSAAAPKAPANERVKPPAVARGAVPEPAARQRQPLVVFDEKSGLVLLVNHRRTVPC
jgi:hypothetical protein